MLRAFGPEPSDLFELAHRIVSFRFFLIGTGYKLGSIILGQSYLDNCPRTRAMRDMLRATRGLTLARVLIRRVYFGGKPPEVDSDPRGKLECAEAPT